MARKNKNYMRKNKIKWRNNKKIKQALSLFFLGESEGLKLYN